MQVGSIFKFTPPGKLELTGVCVARVASYSRNARDFHTYLCYSQNRLFTMIAEITYFATENGMVEGEKFTYGEIVVDYAVLPDFDIYLEDNLAVV